MLSAEVLERRLNESIRIGTEVHSLGEWLARVDINYNGYLARRSRGMTTEEALTTPRGKVFERAMEKPKEKAKRVEYKFVRNGGGAGTWKWVEVDE